MFCYGRGFALAYTPERPKGSFQARLSVAKPSKYKVFKTRAAFDIKILMTWNGSVASGMTSGLRAWVAYWSVESFASRGCLWLVTPSYELPCPASLLPLLPSSLSDCLGRIYRMVRRQTVL